MTDAELEVLEEYLNERHSSQQITRRDIASRKIRKNVFHQTQDTDIHLWTFDVFSLTTPDLWNSVLFSMFEEMTVVNYLKLGLFLKFEYTSFSNIFLFF